MIDQVSRGTTDHFFVERIHRNGSFVMESSHFHDEYELYYLIKGSGIYHIDGREFKLKKGSLVVLNKNTIHRTIFARDQEHQRFLIEFTANQYIEQFINLINFDLDNFFHQYTGIYFVDTKHHQQVIDLFKVILTETQQKEENFQSVIALKLTELLLLITLLDRGSFGDADNVSLNPYKERLVQSAITYIHEHLTEDVQLHTIAEAMYINKSYLSRVFKETTTLTTSEYINLERIRIAKRYLTVSSLTIEEVAHVVGYKQMSYFIKVFKKYTELTPLQYRKQTQKLASNIRQNQRTDQ